jgi:hypothetical protein
VIEARLFLREPAEGVSSTLNLKMETDPVSKTLCFVAFKILCDIQSKKNQEF